MAEVDERVVLLAVIREEVRQVGDSLVGDVGEFEVLQGLDNIFSEGGTRLTRLRLVWESEREERTPINPGVTRTVLRTAQRMAVVTHSCYARGFVCRVQV